MAWRVARWHCTPPESAIFGECDNALGKAPAILVEWSDGMPVCEQARRFDAAKFKKSNGMERRSWSGPRRTTAKRYLSGRSLSRGGK
jgi:hypothetical protein